MYLSDGNWYYSYFYGVIWRFMVDIFIKMYDKKLSIFSKAPRDAGPENGVEIFLLLYIVVLFIFQKFF